MDPFIRPIQPPSPLFLPTPGVEGYLAMAVYHPGSAWVSQGLGQAYRVWAGRPCLVKNGLLYKLVEMSDDDVESDEYDIVRTGARDELAECEIVWLVVDGEEEDPYVEAFAQRIEVYAKPRGLEELEDGEYTLVGPGIGENVEFAMLMPKLGQAYINTPRDYAGLREFLEQTGILGLRWVYKDAHGQTHEAMVLRSDFGEDTPDDCEHIG